MTKQNATHFRSPSSSAGNKGTITLVRKGESGSRRYSEGGRSLGEVKLIGCGPNDPELLTIKAFKAIRDAQVLVYDRLINQDILSIADSEVETIYVGKRCGQPSMKQEAINGLLVRLAREGKQVVRLKGGDPFIFGRGGEEALELAKYQIPFEVIPGITAAIGCASRSLIPLTHRGVSRSVTLVTGNVVTGALPSWSGLVQSGQTLVFYMGLEKAQDIQQGLMENGLSGNTPVAIVIKGCSDEEQIHTFELKDMMEKASELKGMSPALMILGEVVTIRSKIHALLSQTAVFSV
ncbi:uroporphyrinogen-III C-methyltransferase [Vibrio nigripulchritudo]|uniref:uroporphyrinogen-III C-methyltransferase n=1 Tax=Vibrio nigripulchritudo TaxID=28173 RepID=UPI0024916673|nr:uroporphyrinogen-III C-methyltransferase [Vibrio nigripulchritudo]BDU39243.1 uroporphyrin-III C-methyltransferase [Vibrio nigripulchritudo]BDU44963.1 uroporphyrin-III C-methyltransferase [Vibrio nigripulchritudo]